MRPISVSSPLCGYVRKYKLNKQQRPDYAFICNTFIRLALVQRYVLHYQPAQCLQTGVWLRCGFRCDIMVVMC